MEWVDFEVLEPFRVAGYVHPGVKDRQMSSFFIKFLEHIDVILEVVTLILLNLNSWKHRNSAAFLVVNAPFLEVGIGGYLAKVSLGGLRLLSWALLVNIIRELFDFIGLL